MRQLFYWNEIVARPNVKVLKHINGRKNLALVVCRQGGASNLEHWDCAFVVDRICDQNIFRRGGGTVMPLYCYSDEFGREVKKPNINESILKSIEEAMNTRMSSDLSGFSPEDLLGYVYAILNSEKYRTKYHEYMSKDFPRIPYPKDYSVFTQLAEKGKALIMVQTQFDSLSIPNEIVFEQVGNNLVEKASYKDGNLFINKKQYFTPVTQCEFDYTIGGNSPLQKWLKDRKGEALSEADIAAFIKIIATIKKSIELVHEIDEIITVD